MSFRNTIDPTVGKLRKNAGKNYQESVPVTNTDNSISPVRMFRKNAGKVYTAESTQQIIEIAKPQLMRVGGKQRGSGGAIADTKAELQKRIYAYFPLSNANKQSGYNAITSLSSSPNSWVTGKIGNCANFTGSQFLLDSNQRIKFSDLSQFFISFWFNPANNSGFGVPISKGSGEAVSQWELHCFHSANSDFYGFYCAYDSSNFRNVAWGGFTSATWWHCVFEFSSVLGRLALYVNNDLKQEVLTWPTNTPIVNYGNGFRIGGTAEGSFFFNGLVDEIAIILGNTNQSERDWLYNSGNGNSLV